MPNFTTKLDESQEENLRLTPHQQAHEYYRCNHERSEIRYKIYTNDTRHYFQQCLNCGRAIGSAISRKDIDNIDKVTSWDTRVENAYRFLIDEMTNQLRNEQQELWETRQTEWDQQYNEYLQSPQWKEKRRRVLVRDQHLCQACLKRTAQQVHHKTYEYPFGKEPLFVLASVCQYCHGALHELNPNSRSVTR